MKKTIFITSIVSALITIATMTGLQELNYPGENTVKIEHVSAPSVTGAVYTLDNKGEIIPLDFTGAAKQVMPAVVHIKSSHASVGGHTYQYRRLPDPFKDFFGEGDLFERFFGPRFETPQHPIPEDPQLRVGSGSGVIINSDGYIVTNNHVIDQADDIEVTLHDNRTFKASVIGTDPSTDLALLQVRASGLPYLPLVNSDDVKIGEWVLAVGNPFNLNSTVTAGIVSAKARNINILNDQYAIESFIQTDAAINQGNSGGALVNLQGGLIGINTAIASPTGYYSGYGFAVPSNIVNKVVEDLLKYGTVQRGYLGVTIRGVVGSLAKEKDLEVDRGVYVDSVAENSAAEEAGIQAGDVILEVEGKKVETAPQLQELIARHRPGDNLELKVDRFGEEQLFDITLKNRDGKTEIMAKDQKDVLAVLGAEFEKVDSKTAKKLDINGGVKVTRLYAGKLRKHTNMKEGFIITKVDDKKIKDIDDLVDALENKKGGVLMEGVYEDYPGVYYYAFGL